MSNLMVKIDACMKTTNHSIAVLKTSCQVLEGRIFVMEEGFQKLELSRRSEPQRMEDYFQKRISTLLERIDRIEADLHARIMQAEVALEAKILKLDSDMLALTQRMNQIQFTQSYFT